MIREGMKGMAGIGKVALYGREYLIKVQPRERGLIILLARRMRTRSAVWTSIDELRRTCIDRGQGG